MKLVPLKVTLTIDALGAATYTSNHITGVLKAFACSTLDGITTVDVLCVMNIGDISTTIFNVAGVSGTGAITLKQQDKTTALANIAANYSEMHLCGIMTITLANGTPDDEVTLYFLIECGDNEVIKVD